MLSYLVEQRRALVDDRVRITNRLRSALKQYYPQVLEWFDDNDTPMVCDFLTRWPTLLQAKRARKNALTLDEAVIVPHRLQALILLDQLRVMLDAIKQYDTEIERVASAHADYELFSALPGRMMCLLIPILHRFGYSLYIFYARLSKYSSLVSDIDI